MTDLNILRGAEFAAAANTLGLSIDDAIALVARKQQKLVAREEIIKSPEAMAQGLIEAARRVQGVNDELPADIDDLLTIPNREVQFGEEGNQDELQNFGGLDKNGRVNNQELALAERDKVKEARDPNVFLRRKLVGKDDRGRKQYGMEEVFVPEGRPLPDEFKEAAILRDFGLRVDNPRIGPVDELVKVRRGKERFIRVGDQEVRRLKDVKREEVVKGFREEVAPAQQVMAEAKRRVEAAGPANIPGAYDVIGQLDDNVQGNRDAEAALVREMVARDNQRFDPDLREVNDYLAGGQAEGIAKARFGINGGGAQADDALARIGVIGEIGHAKNAADFNVGVDSIRDGREFNYDALPRDLAERYERQAEILNAPIQGELSSRMQWLAGNVPDNRDNGVFGDFPQVGINEQLNAVNDGLRKVNFGGQGIDPSLANVRGINGLQRAVDAVIALGAEKGEGFFRLEDGKNIPVANPGINEVLQKIGFNDNRKQNLAGALFALQMAQDKRKGNMLNDSRIFGGMDLNNGMPVARVGRAKIEGKEVAGQLQALDGRRADPPLNVQELGQARMPFIGGVQGEAMPRAQFLRGKGVGMTPEQRVAAFGPKNAAIANRLERERDILFGMPKGPVDPANPPSGAVDSFAEQLRGKDAEIEQLAQLRNKEANAREVNEAFERVGLPLEGKGQMLLGGQIVQPMAIHRDPAGLAKAGRNWEANRPERNLVPDSVWNNPALKGKATSAVVNPVSQVSPEMGNGGIPPQPPAVTAVGAPAPEPEKYQRMGYKFRPDGASRGDRNRREVIKRLERGRTQRRTGAAVGGALAGIVGLDALIGGERDKRDQEVYQ